MSASSIATKWEEILPPYQDAAALHMNASELAVYDQAQQTLTQSAAAERDLWTRMRERKKARQREGLPELDARDRAQQSQRPFSPRERGGPC
jgi:hypothetical protein